MRIKFINRGGFINRTQWEERLWIGYRGFHAHSCIRGNQGNMAGNSMICVGIQSQLIFPEFIYLMLSV